MTRFVVCGEALIDLVKVEGGDVGTLATTWSALSAGGPMNSAIALARLGERVDFLGRLGADGFADQLAAHLAANGVGLSLAVRSDEATSLAVVSLDQAGKASYTFHFDGTANFGWRAGEMPALTDSDWLHFGSLVTVVQPGATALLDWVSSTPARLSMDVNVRPSVMPDPVAYWEAVEPWLRAVGAAGGIIKASDEDIAFLAAGSGSSADPLETAAAWARSYGPRLVVVTMGGAGAAAITPDGSLLAETARLVTVVDTVGAGDTFMAGFLASYVRDADVRAALVRGGAAAAIVCTRRGANPPTAAEVESFLAG